MLMLTQADAEQLTAPPCGRKEKERRESYRAGCENKHTNGRRQRDCQRFELKQVAAAWLARWAERCGGFTQTRLSGRPAPRCPSGITQAPRFMAEIAFLSTNSTARLISSDLFPSPPHLPPGPLHQECTDMPASPPPLGALASFPPLASGMEPHACNYSPGPVESSLPRPLFNVISSALIC